MTGILGYFIVCAVLAVVVALAIRSIWRGHRSGGHCSGNCAHCGQCGGHRSRTDSSRNR